MPFQVTLMRVQPQGPEVSIGSVGMETATAGNPEEFYCE